MMDFAEMKYFKQYIVVFTILLLSIGNTQLLIQDAQVYDIQSNRYYSDNQFIHFLNDNSHFKNDKYFGKYKKSVNRLKFKYMKYAYGYSLLGVITGIDNYNNPEQNPENPEVYKDNFAASVVVPLSYYAFNKVRRGKSLYYVVKKYNDIYYEEKPLEQYAPYTWSGAMSLGFFNEKIPISFFDASFSLHTSAQAQFYGTVHSIIFGGGIGIGYKYYYTSKIEPSPFISICAHSSCMGDLCEPISGVSIAIGYSKYLAERNYYDRKFNWKNLRHSNELKTQKIFLNMGLSCTYGSTLNNSGRYEEEYIFQLFPFINLEFRY